MPRFTIYPNDPVFSSTDVTTEDASRILHLMSRLKCNAADVHREGEYLFSLQAADMGAWTVFHREHAEARKPSQAPSWCTETAVGPRKGMA
jgi:hypothetical protein